LTLDALVGGDAVLLGEPLPAVPAFRAVAEPAVVRPHVGALQDGRGHLDELDLLDAVDRLLAGLEVAERVEPARLGLARSVIGRRGGHEEEEREKRHGAAHARDLHSWRVWGN